MKNALNETTKKRDLKDKIKVEEAKNEEPIGKISISKSTSKKVKVENKESDAKEGLMTSNLRSLFSSMKKKDANKSSDDGDKSDTNKKLEKPNRFLRNPVPIDNQISHPGLKTMFAEDESEAKNFNISEVKIPLPSISKTQNIFKNDSDNTGLFKAMMGKDSFPNAMNPFNAMPYGRLNEKNISNFSNLTSLSNNQGLQNFNFSSQNNMKMNLSRPTEINFENLNKVPNISNLAPNMMNNSGTSNSSNLSGGGNANQHPMMNISQPMMPQTSNPRLGLKNFSTLANIGADFSRYAYI